MKKGIFIENILLRINGGTINDESSVQRVDIEAYIPASVNWAMGKAYNINLKEGDRDFPSLFYGSYDSLPIIRTSRLPHVVLPKGVVALYGNQGMRFVSDNAGYTYSPLSDSDLHTVEYYKDKMFGKFYRLKPAKVDLYNASPIAETVDAEFIVRVEDLADTDELPIQAGLELEAIQVCVEFFTGQRQIGGDKQNDKKDINA